MIVDAAAAVRGLTVALGERLGLYRALAEHGPLTPEELAKHTGITPRYAEEWLHAQLSADYVERHPSSNQYTLPAAHAPVLADSSAVTFTARLLHRPQGPVRHRGPAHRRVPHRRGRGLGRTRPRPGHRHGQPLPALLPAPPRPRVAA
ncbi:hypothetical protein LUW77_26920 [Streptomyces radiopugnans]|nr:hypothetical protein LUW77_26920 [Streptomyces radiopugnans]